MCTVTFQVLHAILGVELFSVPHSAWQWCLQPLAYFMGMLMYLGRLQLLAATVRRWNTLFQFALDSFVLSLFVRLLSFNCIIVFFIRIILHLAVGWLHAFHSVVCQFCRMSVFMMGFNTDQTLQLSIGNRSSGFRNVFKHDIQSAFCF